MKMFEGVPIAEKLLPLKEFRLFRDYDVKAMLQQVPDPARERYHMLAKRWLGYEHPQLTADLYMEYSHNLNRCNWEDLYINRRTAVIELLMASLLEGSKAYLSTIVNTLWLILLEPTWVNPAHGGYCLPEYDLDGKQGIELYSAETGAVVALAYYFLKDEFDQYAPQLNRRIRAALQERTIRAYMENEYGWMGLHGEQVNNWNPWIHSNVMMVSAILGDDTMHRAVVERCLALTENYVRCLPLDGSCNEGARYWNLSLACVMDCAEIVYDMTGGAVDLRGHEVIAKGSQYILAVYDRYGHAANLADCSVNFYPDCSLLVRIGRHTNQPRLVDFGAYLFRVDKLRSIHDNFYRQIENMLELSLLPPPHEPTFDETLYLPGIQVFSVHKNDCLFVMKGGNNQESHNHNDLGSFVFYRGRKPALIDPGVDLYSGHTFFVNRYLNWYMQSAYHNLPNVNGVQQVPGGFKGIFAPDMPEPGPDYHVTQVWPEPEACACTMELKDAYPTQAQIASWKRRGQLEGTRLTVTDTWDIGGDGKVDLHYMFYAQPKLVAPGRIEAADGTVFTFDPQASVKIESVDLMQTFDKTRRNIWESKLVPRLFMEQWFTDCIYRVTCTVTANRGQFTITAE